MASYNIVSISIYNILIARMFRNCRPWIWMAKYLNSLLVQYTELRLITCEAMLPAAIFILLSVLGLKNHLFLLTIEVFLFAKVMMTEPDDLMNLHVSGIIVSIQSELSYFL